MIESPDNSGGLGGLAQQGNVRKDLVLIGRLIDLGTVTADRFPEVLDLCREIRNDPRRNDRDRLRAAEVEAKVLAMSMAAAVEANKNARLDEGKATENVGHFVVIKGPDPEKL